LEPGKFDVSYAVLDEPPLRISRRSLNAGFRLNVEFPPERSQIGFVGGSPTPARWFGADLYETSLIATRSEIQLSTTGPSVIYAVLIDEKELQRRFPGAPDGLNLLERIRDRSVGRDSLSGSRLRAFLVTLFAEYGSEAGMKPGGPPVGTVAGTLIPLMASALRDLDAHSVEPSKSLTRRLAAVRACEAYMRF
jgi:hypothetical protein